jgi:hypothetical protein
MQDAIAVENEKGRKNQEKKEMIVSIRTRKKANESTTMKRKKNTRKVKKGSTAKTDLLFAGVNLKSLNDTADPCQSIGRRKWILLKNNCPHNRILYLKIFIKLFI